MRLQLISMMIDYHQKKVLITGSVYGTNESYYPQVLLKESKYLGKNKTMESYITKALFDSDYAFNVSSDIETN